MAKYIIFDLGLAVVFDEILTHKDVARCSRDEVVAAGFCDIQDNGCVKVYGHSESLGIPSRPQDAHLIQLSLSRRI